MDSSYFSRSKRSDIFNRLKHTKEILVTRDIGFANHIFHLIVKGESFSGSILIREQRLTAIKNAWLNFLNHPSIPKGIIVLSETRIRIRDFK